MISVLTTNVFPERRGLLALIRCMGLQTCKDFEWILMDGFHDGNADMVQRECDKYFLKNVKHVPLCPATHVPRRYHWEAYNNALLLASNDLFLRIGVFRWVHPKTVEMTVKAHDQGFYVDLHQSHSDRDISWYLYTSGQEIVESDGLNPEFSELRTEMTCANGMFSFDKDHMIWINGNNEASTLLVHHEDADLNARWKGLMHRNKRLDGVMIRIGHNKSPLGYIRQMEEPSEYPCMRDGCPAGSSSLFHLQDDFPEGAIKFIHDDFEWCKCPQCGTIIPMDSDDYLMHIEGRHIAPIGVDGRIGRDIRILRRDIDAVESMDEKLNLLQSSHTSKRYLGGEN